MVVDYFTWAESDHVDAMMIEYRGCTLRKDVGLYKRGQRITIISVDYLEGMMAFYDENGELSAIFELALEIVE